jgi:site-specific DNA-methyltransferase (adenine-specific)
MDYKTPPELYKNLDDKYRFTFDPCPINPTFDGLSIDWGDSNFVNPPYGRHIKRWVKKSFLQAQKGRLVVLLIPSRTCTKYWHKYVMQAQEILFIKGRLRFDGLKYPAPFSSAIFVFIQKTRITPPLIESVDVNGLPIINGAL